MRKHACQNPLLKSFFNVLAPPVLTYRRDHDVSGVSRSDDHDDDK